MNDINLKYLEDHYLEFAEISKTLSLSAEALQQLIDQQLIPEASYTVDLQIVIRSPLNDCHEISSEKKYFPKSILSLIKNNIQQPDSEKFKRQFKANLLSHLQSHRHKTFAYEDIFAKNGDINLEKFELILEKEWHYFCQGVYGICTLDNNEQAIINKEIVTQRILDFIEHKPSMISTTEINQLEALNHEFNAVTSQFAPYQRDASSRNRYLNTLLKACSREDLIQQYD